MVPYATEVRLDFKGNILESLPVLDLQGGQQREDYEMSGTYSGCD